jgi:hypothetical protein
MLVQPGRHVFDATTPSNVPSHQLAIVYVNLDGSFAWSQEEVDRMEGIIGISESTDPAYARFARCFAVEPGADSPERSPDFIRARHHHGHKDAMGYVNLSNWAATERACIDAGFDPDWFVAHPGDRHPDRLRSPIHGKKPVLVQIAFGRGFDTSLVMRPMEFTRPAHFHATG